MATINSDQEMEIEDDSLASNMVETDSKLIKKPDDDDEDDDDDEESASRKWKVIAQNFHDEEYSMANKPRGKAIIFNHYVYDSNFKKREGTQRDKERIEKVLTDLGFETHPHDDKTFLEIQEILNNVSKENHSKYDCLVIVVMTHGKISEIENTEKKKIGKLTQISAKDKLYNEEELWKPFSEGKCHQTLLGKPILIFIQACRSGEDKDKNAGTWVSTRSQKEASDDIEEKLDFYSIPHAADLLIARSTFEGCTAIRHKRKGTWFIQTLCKELEEDMKRDNERKYDLLRILTRVNRIVAFKYPEGETVDVNQVAKKKQMPNFYSTLTRMVYFKNSNERESD